MNTEENIGRTLYDSEARGIFNSEVSLTKQMEEMINKWNYTKLTRF